MSRAARNFAVGALAILATATASCTTADDSADEPSRSTTTAAATPADDAPDETTTSTSEIASDDAEDPADDVVLTATATGVTATSIRIGVMLVDAEELASLGIVIGAGDVEAQWRSFVDAVNADGGVLGRQIEPHFVTYSALSEAASDVACVELTEDIGVFWVSGAILRDNPICFTSVHETIAFPAPAASPDAVRQAVAPFRSLFPSQTDQADVFARASVASGIYDGGPVGVIRAGADNAPATVVAEALQAEGIEVFAGEVTASATDQLAVDQEISTAFERFRFEGVERVVLAGIGTRPLVIAEQNGYDEFDFVLTTALDPGLIDRQGIDPQLLAGVFSIAESFVGTADQHLLAEDPNVQRCVEIYEQQAGAGAIEFEPGAELANLGPTLQACDLIDTFVAVATAAGPELTNDTFGAALESIGELDLATVAFASGEPDKTGLSDTAIPVRYDADQQLWVPQGDPIDTRS